MTNTLNFKRGIDILKKYEDNPSVEYMGGGEWYVGDMTLWERKISKEEVIELQSLGFHWYEEAECLLFNGSNKPIH